MLYISYNLFINLNNSINKKIKIIENDINLHTNAKRTAKRKLLEKARRELEALKSKKRYSSMIEELESKLPDESLDKEDSILRFLREKEIRDRLVCMTERQILSHFSDSLFDGSNPLIIDAILNAPPGFEMIKKKDLEKLREVRVKKLDPEISAEIEQMEFDEMWHFVGSKKTKDGLSKRWTVIQAEPSPGLLAIVMLRPSSDYTKKSST